MLPLSVSLFDGFNSKRQSGVNCTLNGYLKTASVIQYNSRQTRHYLSQNRLNAPSSVRYRLGSIHGEKKITAAQQSRL
jgi:hypothetical protein